MKFLEVAPYEVTQELLRAPLGGTKQLNVNVNVLNKKFSEECVGLCEEMGLQPVSALFTTDGG